MHDNHYDIEVIKSREEREEIKDKREGGGREQSEGGLRKRVVTGLFFIIISWLFAAKNISV